MLVRKTLIAVAIVGVVAFALISMWPAALALVVLVGVLILVVETVGSAKALHRKRPASELPVVGTQHPLVTRVDELISKLGDYRLRLALEPDSDVDVAVVDSTIDRLVYLLGQVKLTEESSSNVLQEAWRLIEADFQELGGPAPNLGERLASLPNRFQELVELHGLLDISLDNPASGDGRVAATDYIERARALPRLEPSDDGLEKTRAGDHAWVDGGLYLVDEVSDYRESYEGRHYTWFEAAVTSLRTGERTWIEWERDDRLEVALSEGRVTLSELSITRDDLNRIDDDEEGSFRHAGRVYEYEDSGHASYHRQGKGGGEKLYYYDFATPDGRRSIGIEKWGGEYQVHLSRAVDAGEVRIYRTNEKR